MQIKLHYGIYFWFHLWSDCKEAGGVVEAEMRGVEELNQEKKCWKKEIFLSLGRGSRNIVIIVDYSLVVIVILTENSTLDGGIYARGCRAAAQPLPAYHNMEIKLLINPVKLFFYWSSACSKSMYLILALTVFECCMPVCCCSCTQQQ